MKFWGYRGNIVRWISGNPDDCFIKTETLTIDKCFSIFNLVPTIPTAFLFMEYNFNLYINVT